MSTLTADDVAARSAAAPYASLWDSAKHAAHVLLHTVSPCCSAPLTRPRGTGHPARTPWHCTACSTPHAVRMTTEGRCEVTR